MVSTLLYQIKPMMHAILLSITLLLSTAYAAPKATQAQVDALQVEVRLLQQQLEQQGRLDLSAGLHIIQRRLQNMERELQDLRESNQRLRRQLSKLEEQQRRENSEPVQTPRDSLTINSNASVFSSSEAKSAAADWVSVVGSGAALSEQEVAEIDGDVGNEIEQPTLVLGEDNPVNSASVLRAEIQLPQVIESEVLKESRVADPVNTQGQAVSRLEDRQSVDERGGISPASNGVEQGQNGAENVDKAMSEVKVGASVIRETQDSGETTNAYRDAFLLLKQARYVESIEAFQQFLIHYPHSKYAANAQYWLAEAVYVRKQYDQALIEFTKVIEDYPASSKVPDARLKVGYTFYELGRWKESREILTQLRSEFSDSTVAGLAQQRLERLEREGR